MSLKLRNVIVYLFTLLFVLSVPCQMLSAQDHVVSTRGLHQALVKSSATRQTDISKIERFFSSQLARQTDRIQNDFAAGALSNEQLTYIIIALATAVVVILILKA